MKPVLILLFIISAFATKSQNLHYSFKNDTLVAMSIVTNLNEIIIPVPVIKPYTTGELRPLLYAVTGGMHPIEDGTTTESILQYKVNVLSKRVEELEAQIRKLKSASILPTE